MPPLEASCVVFWKTYIGLWLGLCMHAIKPWKLIVYAIKRDLDQVFFFCGVCGADFAPFRLFPSLGVDLLDPGTLLLPGSLESLVTLREGKVGIKSSFINESKFVERFGTIVSLIRVFNIIIASVSTLGSYARKKKKHCSSILAKCITIFIM